MKRRVTRFFRVDELDYSAGPTRVKAHYEIKAHSRDEAIRKIQAIVGRRALRAVEVTGLGLFLGWLDSMRLAFNL